MIESKLVPRANVQRTGEGPAISIQGGDFAFAFGDIEAFQAFASVHPITRIKLGDQDGTLTASSEGGFVVTLRDGAQYPCDPAFSPRESSALLEWLARQSTTDG